MGVGSFHWALIYKTWNDRGISICTRNLDTQWQGTLKLVVPQVTVGFVFCTQSVTGFVDVLSSMVKNPPKFLRPTSGNFFHVNPSLMLRVILQIKKYVLSYYRETWMYLCAMRHFEFSSSASFWCLNPNSFKDGGQSSRATPHPPHTHVAKGVWLCQMWQ